MAADCCPRERSFYNFDPSLVGNVILLVVSILLAVGALFLGHRNRTMSFSAALVAGLTLGSLGPLGQILLFTTGDSLKLSAVSLVGTTTGPVFSSASLLLIEPHLALQGGASDGSVWLTATSIYMMLVLCGFMVCGVVVEIVAGVWLAMSPNQVRDPQFPEGSIF